MDVLIHFPLQFFNVVDPLIFPWLAEHIFVLLYENPLRRTFGAEYEPAACAFPARFLVSLHGAAA
jgi:hypothetical protein